MQIVTASRYTELQAVHPLFYGYIVLSSTFTKSETYPGAHI